jgi:hypothetical protein
MNGAWKPRWIGTISFLESHRVTERERMARGYSGLLELKEMTSYKNDYSKLFVCAKIDWNIMILNTLLPIQESSATVSQTVSLC